MVPKSTLLIPQVTDPHEPLRISFMEQLKQHYTNSIPEFSKYIAKTDGNKKKVRTCKKIECYFTKLCLNYPQFALKLTFENLILNLFNGV